MVPRERGERPPAWIETIGVERAGGELARIYRRLGYRAGPARIIASQALHPRGLEGHVRLYRALMYGPSPLSRAGREALAVVVSAFGGCFY